MHAVLANEAEYVDFACISGKLYHLGRYPGAVLANTQEKVIGEVYRFSNPTKTLETIDDYEGLQLKNSNGHEYRREIVTAELISGKNFPAWVYLYNRPTKGLIQIESGDYADFRR